MCSSNWFLLIVTHIHVHLVADFYGETVSSHWWGLLELAVVEPVLVKLRVAASGKHSRICNVEASPGETVSSHWWGTLSTFSESTCSHHHIQSQHTRKCGIGRSPASHIYSQVTLTFIPRKMLIIICAYLQPNEQN